MSRRPAVAAVLVLSVGLHLGCDVAPEPAEPSDVAVQSSPLLASMLPSQPDAFNKSCLDATIPFPNDPSKTTVIHLSPTGSDVTGDGSAAKPVWSLAHVHDVMLPAKGVAFPRDYLILAHGGTYYGQFVSWNKFDANHRIHIKAAPGEVPIFDGYADANATTTLVPYLIDFRANADTGPRTVGNYTVEGLSIRHYFNYALGVRGDCNRLYNNKIREIGTAYVGTCTLPTGQKHYKVDGCTETDTKGCTCEGFAGFDVVNASRNTFKRNDVIDTINTRSWKLIHPFYLAHSAQQNLIQNNYVRNTTGNPVIKFRDNCNDNRIFDNYVERAGGYCDITGKCYETQAFFANSPQADTPEVDSTNNELARNVVNFSASGATMPLVDDAAFFPNTNDPYQYTAKYFQGTSDPDEKVVATAIADVDGDGLPEVFVALNYPHLHYSKIVYADGGGSEPNLRTVAYTFNDWQITGLAAGNFTGNGAEVVASFYREVSDTTTIFKGYLVSGVYSFSGLATRLLEKTGWQVTAMTAGKFAGDTTDKLITAAVVNGTQYVFRGDGSSKSANGLSPGVDNGTPLYSSPSWRVSAMTSGKVCGGSSNGLVSAFTYVGAGSPLNRIYCGNGVDGAATTRVLDDPTQIVYALTVGKFDGTNPRLVSAIRSAGITKVYLSDGTNPLAKVLYSNGSWNVTSLSAGRIESDGDSDDELLAAFDNEKQTEVHWGDGLTASGGLTNRGEYYRNKN